MLYFNVVANFLPVTLLIIMSIAGCHGQKEYGIGKEGYKAWDFGFADPRNLFTGTISPELSNLSNLASLQLYDNQLY